MISYFIIYGVLLCTKLFISAINTISHVLNIKKNYFGCKRQTSKESTVINYLSYGAQRGRHKLDCLGKFVRVMVPRQQLDAVREEAAQTALEASRLHAAMERMVPRSDLFAREADNERLEREVARLAQAIESMVPRAHYDALQERLEAALAFHRAETDGMRRLVVAAAAVVADPLAGSTSSIAFSGGNNLPDSDSEGNGGVL